jgi:hypothetical protein
MSNITEKEAFELGFLQYCADAGYTRERTDQLIKLAGNLITKRAANISDEINKYVNENLLSGDWKSRAANGALVGGTLIGGGAGLGMLARRLQGDFLDPEDVKKQELINEYKNQTRHALQPQAATVL